MNGLTKYLLTKNSPGNNSRLFEAVVSLQKGEGVRIMKMEEALGLIKNESPCLGFMVHFEWREGSILRTDYFPDRHLEEPLIKTEEEAWTLAHRFANVMGDKICNIYVVQSNWVPVSGYERQTIKNR